MNTVFLIWKTFPNPLIDLPFRHILAVCDSRETAELELSSFPNQDVSISEFLVYDREYVEMRLEAHKTIPQDI